MTPLGVIGVQSRTIGETSMYSTTFADLPIKRLFSLNGRDYMKQSTRTAKMLANGRVFYFSKTEVVHPFAW